MHSRSGAEYREGITTSTYLLRTFPLSKMQCSIHFNDMSVLPGLQILSHRLAEQFHHVMVRAYKFCMRYSVGLGAKLSVWGLSPPSPPLSTPLAWTPSDFRRPAASPSGVSWHLLVHTLSFWVLVGEATQKTLSIAVTYKWCNTNMSVRSIAE